MPKAAFAEVALYACVSCSTTRIAPAPKKKGDVRQIRLRCNSSKCDADRWHTPVCVDFARRRFVVPATPVRNEDGDL